MSTKWGAEDYEKAAELCERTGSLHDNDGAYADMLRHASAALTAAAEREKAKDAEITRLREVLDLQLFRQLSEESELLELRERETKLREENERLADQLGTEQGSYQLAASGRDRSEALLAAERQKVQALRKDIERRHAAANRDCKLGWAEYWEPYATALQQTIAEMDALGLTPDPPREK